MNSFLQDLLLLKTSNIDQVYKIVQDISFPLLSICFVLGAVFENFTNLNYFGLFKRMIFALFLISFGSPFLKETVNLSFDISGKIINSVQGTNPVVQLIERARKISNQVKAVEEGTGFIDRSKNAAKGLWESQAFVSKILLDDGLSSAVFIFSYAALMLLGQLFTIVYNFTYVAIPLLSALIVFPPTYSVANSISRTIAWVFLMPIFTMITILLLSSSFSFPQDGSNIYYFTSLENLINFCIMALMLLFVPTVVSGFLSGAGVLTAAETFTKATVMAGLSGGKTLAMAGARTVVMGQNFGLATMAKQGLTKGLDRLGSKSIEARKRLSGSNKDPQSNNVTQSRSSTSQAMNSIEADSSQSKSSSNASSTEVRSQSSNSFVSRTLDKSIVATDSVLNFKKNHIASRAIKTDMSRGHKAQNGQTKTELFSKYKQNAHRQFHKIRPVDYHVSKVRGENPPPNQKPQHSNNKFKSKGYRT